MPRRMRLSDRNVALLRVERSEYTVWDTKITGLGVRVRPSGHRAFIYLDSRDGSSKRRTLGRTTLMKVDKARARCLAVQSAGAEAQKPTVPLFRDFLAGVWKSECYNRQKPSSQRTVTSQLKNQLLPTFGDTPLDRVDPRSVHRWFDCYSATAPFAANRTLDTLCQIMNHAKVHGYIKANPANGVRRNPVRKLNRFLSCAELRRLHDELDRCVAEKPSRAVQADIIRLLACTGCRLSEIRTLKWQDVGVGTLDLCDSKTGPRTVYLNSKTRMIIERQPRTGSLYVFPSANDSARPVSHSLALWYLVRERAGVNDVRLHDLRHTYASHAVMQGFPLPTVARLLGHQQVSMTLRYAHVSDKDVEAAAERVGRAIATICEDIDFPSNSVDSSID